MCQDWLSTGPSHLDSTHRAGQYPSLRNTYWVNLSDERWLVFSKGWQGCSARFPKNKAWGKSRGAALPARFYFFSIETATILAKLNSLTYVNIWCYATSFHVVASSQECLISHHPSTALSHSLGGSGTVFAWCNAVLWVMQCCKELCSSAVYCMYVSVMCSSKQCCEGPDMPGMWGMWGGHCTSEQTAFLWPTLVLVQMGHMALVHSFYRRASSTCTCTGTVAVK